MKKLKMLTLAGVVSLTAGGSAFAQVADIPSLADDAVSTVQSVGPAILTVGGSIIGIAAISLAVRWIKATFF